MSLLQGITVINIDSAEIEQRQHRFNLAKNGGTFQRCPVNVDVSDFTYADVAGISVDQYLNDPVLHAEAQILGQKWVLENIQTDSYGFNVSPRLGAAPSAFGAPLHKSSGNRAWVKPWIKNADDLKRLAAIDPEHTGIEIKALEWKELYERIADRYPVRFGDGEVFYPLANQGLPMVHAITDPLTLAVDLMDSSSFFIALVDDTAFIRDLLAVLTEKTITILRKNQAACGYDGPVFVSSDYAPMVSPDHYADLVVPTLCQIKEALLGPMRLHHCAIPSNHIDIILEEIKPEILNGFKAQADITTEMQVMAERVGDSAYLEPYLDGVTMLHQTEDQIYNDAKAAITLFTNHGCRFHLGAMTCDGHPVDDLAKLNAIMRASENAHKA